MTTTSDNERDRVLLLTGIFDGILYTFACVFDSSDEIFQEFGHNHLMLVQQTAAHFLHAAVSKPDARKMQKQWIDIHIFVFWHLCVTIVVAIHHTLQHKTRIIICRFSKTKEIQKRKQTSAGSRQFWCFAINGWTSLTFYEIDAVGRFDANRFDLCFEFAEKCFDVGVVEIFVGFHQKSGWICLWFEWKSVQL